MIVNRKYICRFCGKEVTVQAEEEKFSRLDAGAHVQDVFPDLGVNYRELMISGICGECFDQIFENDDDEDDSASDDEFFVSKYDEKTDIFSDKYEGD